jgi:peptidoglycan/LPS O-acetylase OafA/YrhL
MSCRLEKRSRSSADHQILPVGGRFYLPQLDGLRFFAFLLVFLHHSPVFPGGSRVASSLKEYGWVGVDLFFVLSAYLLVALLHREHEATGLTDFKKFFIRRALRIYLFIPLLFMAIVGLRRKPALFAAIAVAIAVSQPLLRWGITRFNDNELTLWVVPFLHFDTIFAGLLLGAGVGWSFKKEFLVIS